jgi:transposase
MLFAILPGLVVSSMGERGQGFHHDRIRSYAMTGGSVLKVWTDILQLPGFAVVHVQEDVPAKRYVMTIVPEHAIGVCPHCGKTTQTIKQHRTRDGILDLPIGSHAVELRVRMGQFECDRCGRCFTPSIDFLAEGSHATERLLERAADLIRHSDVANAGRFFSIPERTLGEWYHDYVERQQQRATQTPTGPIRRIGIDELSLKKSTGSSSQ